VIILPLFRLADTSAPLKLLTDTCNADRLSDDICEEEVKDELCELGELGE
jgi:hypothetical protein